MENYIVYAILLLSGTIIGLLYALSRHSQLDYSNRYYRGNPYNPERRADSSALVTTLFAVIVLGGVLFYHYGQEQVAPIEDQSEAPKLHVDLEGETLEARPARESHYNGELTKAALALEGRSAPVAQEQELHYAEILPLPAMPNAALPQQTKRSTLEDALPRATFYVQRLSGSNYLQAQAQLEKWERQTGVNHVLGTHLEDLAQRYKLLMGPYTSREQATRAKQKLRIDGWVLDNADGRIEIEGSEHQRHIY